MSLNIEKANAVILTDGFTELFKEAESLRIEALAVTVKDADDKEAMTEARRVRLELRRVRVAAEKTRKALKEDGLRTGKAIDGIYNLLAYAVVPLEDKLKEQEEFAKREAAAAPDKAKLLAFAETVRNLNVPETSTDEGRALAYKMQDKVDALSQWIEQNARDL